MKRHLTLYALCAHENKSTVSKGTLLKFLLRVYMIKQMQIKSKAFVIGAESLQKHWLVTIESANEKKLRIRQRFDVELQYIIKFYWKKLNEIGKPNSKAYKAIQEKQRCFMRMVNCEVEAENIKLAYVCSYIELMKAFYMLDFAIWSRLQAQIRLDRLKEELPGPKLYQDSRVWVVNKQKMEYMRRIKQWRFRIDQLANHVFENSSIVD